MSGLYQDVLDEALGAVLRVEFTTHGRDVLDYTVVLLLVKDGAGETIRLYDAAHGFNEMHRYTRAGSKQSGVQFHTGTLGEGMRAAIDACKAGYRGMIDGWEEG